MENLVGGIITVLICATGYLFSFRLFRKHRINYAIVLLVGCGLILRLYTATDLYLHPWDERFHALVARNFIEHPFIPTLYDHPVLPYDYKAWYANHVWLHKQPLPLWTMALSMSLFGINEIALRLPSILLSTIGIWITFSIGRKLFNSRVGFIAAFLYSIHGLIIEMTAGRVATDHIDIFFLFFIQLAVLMAIKYADNKKVMYNLLCGVCTGAAILSKWLPALIVLPIWFMLVIGSRKFTVKEILINITFLCIVIIAVTLPWQIYIHTAFPLEAKWESDYNLMHFTKVLEGHGGPFYYHFDQVRILFGEIIYLPLLWFIWKSFRNRRNYKRIILTVWFMVPFLFFSFARTKMQGYTLFTAPAIFIITALFWHYLIQLRHKTRYKWVVYTILILLLALPVRYSIERIKPFELRERKPQWVMDIKSLEFENDKVVLFNVPYPIETMFYANCTAYEGIPDIDTIKGIINSGYKVIINVSDEIDNGIRALNGVGVIELTGI